MQEELKRNAEYNNMTLESETQEQIYRAGQDLAVAKNQGELYTQELAIEKAKEEANNEKQIQEAELALELAKKKMGLNAEKELKQIELDIKKEADNRKLLEVQHET